MYESVHDIFWNPFIIVPIIIALLLVLIYDEDENTFKNPLKPYIDKLRSTKVTKKSQKQRGEKSATKSRKQRSKYSYTGHDKLYPNDDDFIDNKSWTSLRKAQYQQYLTER